MFEYFQTLANDYLIILLINLLFSTIVISLERKNPVAALAWLFFMTFLPGIGFLFFLLLSQNISKRKIFKYTAKESEIYEKFLKDQERAFRKERFHFKDENMKKYSDMIRFHLKLSEAFYSQNNHIEIFTDGKEKFKDLFHELRNAKHHIHILYYIVKNDTLGKELFDILEKKANEGVEVRLLVDFVGGRSISKSEIQALKKSGVEIAFFFPSRFKYVNFKANYRNHRKIVIVDGEIGYVGGFNVGNEYLGLKKRFGYWRDTHLKIRGDSVISLQIRFLLDWRNAANKSFDLSPLYIRESTEYGQAGVQIVSCGPDSINEQIKQGFIKMINKAEKYIYIQTPYFIPDESISEALKIASVSGIDVRIMIPNKPDHPFVYWATYSHICNLIPYGVKVYTYENGFLHAKTITVDDTVCSCGTCNFDIRSFRLNFEVNAFIYDKETATKFKKLFKKDLDYCNNVTQEIYDQRTLLIKFKEAISRLFSPIL